MFCIAMLIVAAVTVMFAAGCSASPSPLVSASGLSSPSKGGASGVQLVANQSSLANGPVVRSITVVGVGKASGAPDVAHVNVGIETSASSIQPAIAENKTKMAALLDAFKKLDIADKDIRTSNYSVYTERQPMPGPESKGGEGPVMYRVSNQVELTLRDVNRLGDALDKAVAAGANNIYGVSFSVADTSKLEADARAKAIANARARAESLAQLSGVSLGDVLSVSEVIGGPGPILVEGVRMSAAMGLGGGAPIQPGELEVNMSVQVTFAIK